jgi:hypothetical protein
VALPGEDVPTSRTYLHERCGGATLVSGENLEWLLDPFLPCSGTFCAGCRRTAGLGAFRWEDTGETIAARRKRLRKMCPPTVKVWGWLLGPLAVAAVGALVGWLMIRRPIEGPVAGALVGALPAAAVMPTVLAKHVWKIDFRAME